MPHAELHHQAFLCHVLPFKWRDKQIAKNSPSPSSRA